MPTPLFDIDDYVAQVTPPNYRLPKWIAVVRSFLYGLKWNMDKFRAYREGEVLSYYSSLVTYVTGDRVEYNFATYESIVDDNTGNAPDISTTQWVLRNKSFIGADERAKYNGRYLNLTWELNRYFSRALTDNGFIGFRQPPYPAPYDFGLGGGTFSDIYLTNVAPAYVSFAFSDASQSLGGISTVSMTHGIADDTIVGSASSYQYLIHIPLTVYNSLGATDAIRESVVRQFVDRYSAIGLGYSIVTY